MIHALRVFLTSGLGTSVIVMILGGLVTLRGPRVLGWWHSWFTDGIHLWNLIPLRTRARERPTVLLEAVNRGAVNQAAEYSGKHLPGQVQRPATMKERLLRALKRVQPARYSPSKAARIWAPSFEELWEPQRSYVVPGGQIVEGKKDFWNDNAVSVVRSWVERAGSGDNVGKIMVSSVGGSGKTTFLHRLFLDLVGGLEAATPLRSPVPMLASANDLKPYTEQITALKQGSDTGAVFADIWLQNHGIELPKYLRESFLKRFSEALRDGDIVLLFDGFDELAFMDLGAFPQKLLEHVKRYVVAQRSDHTVAVTEKHQRSITLESSWDIETIAAHLKLRWPEWPEQQEVVTEVIGQVIRQHDEMEKDQRHKASHWLTLTRNLDLFLKELEPPHLGKQKVGEAPLRLPSKGEIRRRAESQPYLFDLIVARAFKRVADTSARETEIRNRLFAIAINDPTDPRRRMLARAVELNDNTGRHVRDLSELLEISEGDPGVSADRLFFKHAALREYFIAGRIAWELHDTARNTDEGDELIRFAGDSWSAAKREAVADWLRRLDPDGSSTDLICGRLPRPGAGGPAFHPNMLRNLLDLMIGIGRSPDDDQEPIENIDFGGIAGHQLDVRSVYFIKCSFADADLTEAEMSCGSFDHCDFARAQLQGADAVGATFADCDLNTAEVQEMAIESANFIKDGKPSRLTETYLKGRGAVAERTRYRGGFGGIFWKRPKVLLGDAVERLENGPYRSAISSAVRRFHDGDSRNRVYLMDLMAGGSYERIAALREEFERLHILGVDRDPQTSDPDSRLMWAGVELGASRDGAPPREIGLSRILQRYFWTDQLHVIIAKKALHELDRYLQPVLIRECAELLCAGGQLILFADTPGPSEGPVDHDQLDKTYESLAQLRTLLRDPCRKPADVEDELQKRQFDDTAMGQIEFANTWIMVKDWANDNRHEVRHRYFASGAEIRDWAAKAGLGEPVSSAVDYYRINPLNFNELGIQRVLRQVEGQAGEPDRDVRRDIMARWLSEGERFRILVEFTRKQLARNSDLGVALRAQEKSIGFGELHPALEPLKSPETAPEFDLRCTVLAFEKK